MTQINKMVVRKRMKEIYSAFSYVHNRCKKCPEMDDCLVEINQFRRDLVEDYNRVNRDFPGAEYKYCWDERFG